MAGDDVPQDSTPNPPQQPGGGRTLGGAYVPPEPSSSSSQPAAGQQQPSRRGVAGLRTLRDLQPAGGSHAGHGHDHDDDDDDDENHDFFTGGEKSGLAVQNPGAGNPQDHINNILKRARQYAYTRSLSTFTKTNSM